MGQRGIWEHVARQTDLEDENLPGQPIVELAGDRKVIIEGHRGIREYCRERITVGVNYGLVQICGCNLELSQMSRDSLVIRGCIDCVTVKRREQK